MEAARPQLTVRQRAAHAQSWFYIASLLEIAIAVDILQTAWSDSAHMTLAIPLALAAVAAMATIFGQRVGLIATLMAGGVLLAWRAGMVGGLGWGDALGASLFMLTALILVELADQRREHQHRFLLQQAELRAALEREGRRNEEKDQFLALLAHELRNPATVIRGSAQLLERDSLKPRDRAALANDVAVEADRLCALIDDMLSVAVAEDGVAHAAEPVRMDHILPKAIAEFHQRHPQAVRQAIEPDLPLVAASLVQVERVLANLLDNAGKYAPSTSEIALEVHRGGEGVEVDVLDRGPGLGVEASGAVFEVFRPDRPGSMTASYGLGLVISRRLVEANHGRIWAANRDGGGLAVGFSLRAYEGPEIADRALPPGPPP